MPWNADPLILATLVLLVGGYARGVTIVWRRAGVGAVVSRWRVAAFALGAYVLMLALLSPLDAWSHLLFSAHMLQHVLLMLVAAPLLVLGAPLVPLLWALPRGWRRSIARGWNATPWLGRAWHALTGPVVVWCVLTVSLLFWWVVVQPVGQRRIDGGSALLLVFTTKVQSATLGAIITFVPTPIYPLYEAGAALAGMTPMQDQHLAGLIMGTAGGLVFLAAGAYVFLSWLASIERRHRPAGAAYPRVVRAPPLDLGRSQDHSPRNA